MCKKCTFKPSGFNIVDEEGYVYQVSNEISNYARVRAEPGTTAFYNKIGFELDKWKVNPLANLNSRFKKVGHVNTIKRN